MDGNYILLLNCIIVDWFILLYYCYLFSNVCFFFYFHFRSPIIFTLTSQILVDFVLQLLFYLAFVLLYFLSYPLLFLLPDLLSSKSEIKANSFILFSSRCLLRQNTFKFFLLYYYLWGNVLNYIFVIFMTFT